MLTYPSVTFIDAIIARFLLAAITYVVIFFLIVLGIELMFHTNTVRDYRYIAGAMAMASVLGLGVGTLNCFLWTRFPDWERVWGILNRPLFLVSGIFYTYEELPREFAAILWFNPLVHVTATARKGFYPTYEAAFVSPAFVYGVSLVGLVIGLFLLAYHHRRMD